MLQTYFSPAALQGSQEGKGEAERGGGMKPGELQEPCRREQHPTACPPPGG